MLRRFSLRNFKQFRHEVSVDFEPVTVLLGANNSGKSTVLQALSILQYCIETTRQKKNDQVVLETCTVGPEDFGPLPVTSAADLWPGGKTSSPICLKAEFDDGLTLGFEIKFQFNRFAIAPNPAGPMAPSLATWNLSYVPIHSGLALREEYILAPARNARLREQHHGAVIRNLLWDLKDRDKKRWKLLQRVLKQLYPQMEIDVNFDKEIERFIRPNYSDTQLGKAFDLVVSGTGFQQVLQIFLSVLTQGSTLVLLDEPDAHLHARLQVEMMNIFSDLVREEHMQLILATHSPHLLASAPVGALRVMIEGKAHPFAIDAQQVALLDKLGAFDRMEIVPLLRTKAVVFWENRDDSKLVESFARKVWGDEKSRHIWDGLTPLYTYQNPVDAAVHVRAKQVKDLLSTEGLQALATGRQPRFLVIGDRDYRTTEKSRADVHGLLKNSRSTAIKVDLKCHLWSRNEIENYLLDYAAIEKVAVGNLKDVSQAESAKRVLTEAWARLLAEQKGQVQQRIADRMQKEDRGLTYQQATRASTEILDKEWGDGSGLCDAKEVLAALRKSLQTAGIRTRIEEKEIIVQMTAIPPEITKALNLLKKHSASAAPRKRRSTRQAAANLPPPTPNPDASPSTV